MQFFGDLLSYALKKVDDKIKINFNKDKGSYYITDSWVEKIPLGSTLMFELVSPRNKIICEYKETKLYLHGYRDPDLIEHDPREIYSDLKFDFPELYNASNFNDLLKILSNFNGMEKEGCVVVDYTTPNTPRAKIKCESYLKLKFMHDGSTTNQAIFKAVIFVNMMIWKYNIQLFLQKLRKLKEMLRNLKNGFQMRVKIYLKYVRERITKKIKKYGHFGSEEKKLIKIFSLFI